MASVYLAELETEIGFKRKVALKVVRNEFARDDKFIALMSREAMIGSLLQHPNIVQTLEFNEADGRCFLALEYVEGQTLEELLHKNEQGKRGLPVSVALESMVQVLKGLAYAHTLVSPEGEELGIVHRDLKPANIMLSRHGLVKVMDFGIAKARIASANITTAGQVRGTPIYMAPEQVTGKPLDGRADQFAAATVLYELLTGKQMFIATNLVRIMQRVARAEVDDQLSEVERLHPKVSPILERMWKKHPNDRFDSCEEPARLLDDIAFEMKAGERAMRASRPVGKSPPPRSTSSLPEDVADDGTLLGTVGSLVRKLFGSEKEAPVPPPVEPKRKKKRKKKGARRPRQEAATRLQVDAATQTGPASAGPSPTPSINTGDIVFDPNTSQFEIQAQPTDPEADRPPSTPNIAPVRSPNATTEDLSAPGETTAAPGDLPTPRDSFEDGESQDGMDSFFYENFD